MNVVIICISYLPLLACAISIPFVPTDHWGTLAFVALLSAAVTQSVKSKDEE